MQTESDALLAVVSRIDRKAIEYQQMAAAKVLRGFAQAERQESDLTLKLLKKERLTLLRSTAKAVRLDSEAAQKEEKVAINLRYVAAVALSNQEIAESFAAKRRDEAARSVLALAISDIDYRAMA